MIYRIADIAFVVFHSSLILFNLFGWIWKKTRFANLVSIVLTFGSWTLLGLIVGVPGYCPFTEWHFRILEKLGHTGLPTSYIKYLADRLTGMSFSQELVDSLTLWGLVSAFIISLALNIPVFVRWLKRERQKRQEN
ncbi:MAG: DUF2784 domain-containing protein [Bacteroidales bacterium]|jgi:hypothetical protein|nr:DUF2784 domain-containing protein [Bacteroidales bacterium]